MNSTQSNKFNQTNIIIRNINIPFIRASWTNILILIAIVFYITVNKLLIEINLNTYGRFAIIFICLIIILREYVVDVSRILLNKDHLIFQCTFYKRIFTYKNIIKIKIVKHPFWGVSIVKVKIKKGIIPYKFNLGPSLKNNLIFLESAKKLKEFLLKHNIVVDDNL